MHQRDSAPQLPTGPVDEVARYSWILPPRLRCASTRNCVRLNAEKATAAAEQSGIKPRHEGASWEDKPAQVSNAAPAPIPGRDPKGSARERAAALGREWWRPSGRLSPTQPPGPTQAHSILRPRTWATVRNDPGRSSHQPSKRQSVGPLLGAPRSRTSTSRRPSSISLYYRPGTLRRRPHCALLSVADDPPRRCRLINALIFTITATSLPSS